MNPEIRYHGIYRGIVIATNDPEGLGRVTLTVPQVSGTEVTNWAWPITTVDTLPNSNDRCWVMFEGGDPNFPIWLGTNFGVSAPVVEPTQVRWSPVFQATGLTFTGTGTTYPTYNSYYVRYGQFVTFNIKVDLTTVTNFGTGQFKLELPFNPIPSAANHFIAWSWVDPSQPADELNGHKQLIADHIPGSKVLDLHWLKETTASPKPVIESILTQGTPVTFTTASIMYVNGTYIAEEAT
jgi:hypothetical protein